MRKLLDGADYFVHIVPFPKGCGCDGAVTPNDDGTFTIYVDANANHERRIKALEHEIGHIRNDDFYSGRDIREVEDI